MDALIAAKSDELTCLCHRFHVQRLELFGSATRDDFDASSSDLDFLVEFDELLVEEYGDAYFGLLAQLEDLFCRPVDLVIRSAVRNPYLLESIERSRTLLYAA